MSNQATEAIFDALGEPVRRRIVELLAQGPTPVGALAEQLPVGRPAVSKHLRCLSDAGLVEHRSQGTRNLYVLAPVGCVVAQQWLISAWDSVLDAYAEQVASSPDPNQEPSCRFPPSAVKSSSPPTRPEPSPCSRRRSVRGGLSPS